MKEIGGYIEFEKYNKTMLHEDGIKLNSGRNALAYLIEAKNIKKILLPQFMCNSCDTILKKYNIRKRNYNINKLFYPLIEDIEEDEWLYVVNYYGQMTDDDIALLKRKYKNIILDYTQSYYQEPIEGVDTIYSCRKYFGVPDGAILYTDKIIGRKLARDISYGRMEHVLGRFEKSAEEFYDLYKKSEMEFDKYPIMNMSSLTENLLRGIDYVRIRDIRTRNYMFLAQELDGINGLTPTVPEAGFMYPLYINNGEHIRKELQKIKIYIPCLWPNVVESCNESMIEGDFARNILPIPVDQRYDLDDMRYIVDNIFRIM